MLTININKKYPIYISLISYYNYYLKFTDIFYNIIYCPKALFRGFHRFYIFCYSFSIIFLSTNNINKKHLIYISLISYHSIYLKLIDIFYDIIDYLKALFKSFWFYMFYHNFLSTCLYINNINKKYLSYTPILLFII